MANTAASTFITRTFNHVSKLKGTEARSGETYENIALDWLNDVQLRMSRKHDFREMYVLSSGVAGTSVTVASTSNYAFPTGWKAIISVRIINGSDSRKLTLSMPASMDRAIPYPANESTGVPSHYTPLGNTFDLFRIPDAAYTMPIRYIKWPTVITSTATLIDYEPNKDDIVKAGMVACAFDYLQMYDDGKKWWNDFYGLLNDAILVDGYPKDWAPKGEGFIPEYSSVMLGNYYNNPLIFKNP